MNLTPVSTKKKAAVITGITIVVLVLFFLRLIIPETYSYPKRMLLFQAILWGTVVFIFAFAFFIERERVLLPEERYSAEFYLSWIAKFFVISFGVSIVVSIICAVLRMPYYGDNSKPLIEALNKNLPLLLFSAFTAGVTEELICRGYILNRLQLLLKNENLAIGISAAFFCTLHFTYHSFQQLISTFVFGCIFGLHYQRYRSMGALILAHTFIDLVVFLWFKTSV
ncbi:CPBP family intramembrane glutamic endopeptidase [Mucilaginibacter gilvus]|uniref:CPBP family intramembrane metalloprotease n=1 Tax=Mucilaginibacter gilvus TaxID=2305909 RepID=A0A3S3VJ30_9SPHI|nr:type II CAAX endopeptidase family protein [Mucilaginibacter gilvus]RWY49378.1 CPBP family intramembrane metalloprotease [Mucilaginibacter gilvus]